MLDQHTPWQSQCLPWQQAEMDRLVNQHSQDRLPHALLIAGPQGVGKTVFTAALISRLLCTAGRQSPCGHCDSCQQLRAGSHGDYQCVAPVDGKRAISINQVRTAVAFLQKTAGYGDIKLLTLTPADAMTRAASNALLKTLEEPSGNSLLCLVSARPGDLPATVRSRCQRVILAAPNEHDAVSWLSEQTGHEPQMCREAWQLFNGETLTALHSLQTDTVGDRQHLRTTLEDLLRRRAAPMKVLSEIKGQNVEIVLDVLGALTIGILKSRDAAALGKSDALFKLHDDIRERRAALRRGLNLAPEPLLGDLFSRGHGIASE